MLEHEIWAYVPRGHYWGPLAFVKPGARVHRSRFTRSPRQLPDFVEPDHIEIAAQNASLVLLVDDDRAFQRLAESRLLNDTGVILIASHGIPRYTVRRLLNRLQRECNLPVATLTDNDTWGYWIYAVLKRGLMAPEARADYAAVKKLAFVGVRAADAERYSVPKDRIRPWEAQWTRRMQALRKERCFRSQAWQREFDRFVRNKGGLDVRALMDYLGPAQFVKAFLRPRLEAATRRYGKDRG